jgi:hypothetical protein
MKTEKTKSKQNLGKFIQALSSTLTSRAKLAAKLGQHYGGDRDVYEAFGWDKEITYDDYVARYQRQDIAHAIIERPTKATWRDGITLLESDDTEDTALEKEWKELNKRLSLVSRFLRLDMLTGIGCYGVLLLGFKDVNQNADFNKPVEGTKNELAYVKSLGEGHAEITAWDNNPSSPRFNQPITYNITLTNPDNSTPSNITVHWTRIIHVADGLLESETIGTPRLEVIFNRLMDLEKIVGGGAEMFWRGAFPGFQGIVDKDFQDIDTTGLQDEQDEYVNHLRRFFVNRGIEYKALEQQLADPNNNVDVQLIMISIVTGIPKRILMGSERGELSSKDDRNSWNDLIQGRRDNFAEPAIVRAFVDRCVEFGVLPAAENEYKVIWSDLWAPSDKEKAEVGKLRAEALAAWLKEPTAQDAIPPKAFNKFFLGLDQENIELIELIRKESVNEELNDFEEGDNGETA